MHRRAILSAITATLLVTTTFAAAVAAAGPSRVSDSYTETFFDDFIYELCGIETLTTATERWTLKEFSDGSATLHVNRTYVSEDPRLPIEKGAATTFIAADGTRTVVGKPAHLLRPGGGVVVLDAGIAHFGEDLTVRGPHPYVLADDLAPYYCPAT